MNTPADTPIDPALWTLHRARAAALLPGNFADNVLRAARLERARAADAPLTLAARLARILHNPFALSGLTAAACLVAAVIFHTQTNSQANAQNLADWRDIVAQTETLEPL